MEIKFYHIMHIDIARRYDGTWETMQDWVSEDLNQSSDFVAYQLCDSGQVIYLLWFFICEVEIKRHIWRGGCKDDMR